MGDHADDITLRSRVLTGLPMQPTVYHLDVGCERPAVGMSYHLTTDRAGAPERLSRGQRDALVAAVAARDVQAVRGVLQAAAPGFLARLDAVIPARQPSVADAVECLWHNGTAPSIWVQGAQTAAP